MLTVTCHREPLVIDIRENPRLTRLDDGSLLISVITRKDQGTYQCMAYNGIGESAIMKYTMIVLSRYP